METIKKESKKFSAFRLRNKTVKDVSESKGTKIKTNKIKTEIKQEPVDHNLSKLQACDTLIESKASKKLTESDEQSQFKRDGPFTKRSQEGHFAAQNSKLVVNILVPPSLHGVLLKDNDFVNGKHLTYKLPFEWTIKKILETFVKTGRNRSEKSEFLEYERTIQTFFDFSLENKCLYPTERPQFERLSAEQKSNLCDVYGGVHLLRFFTKFGCLLRQCKHLERAHVDETAAATEEFFRFLEANLERFFA